VHLHELLFCDLLVQFVRDRDRQQQARPGDTTDGAQHVGHDREQADQGTADDGDLWDIAFEHFLDDADVLAEPGDLHPGVVDLLGRRFWAHVRGLHPEDGKDRAADDHERQVDGDTDQDLPGFLARAGPPHPVTGGVDRGQIVEQPTGRVALRVGPEPRWHVRQLGVQDAPEELDVGLERANEDHRQDAGVDELHGEATTRALDPGVRERNLDTHRLGVDDHHEDQQRGEQRDQLAFADQERLQPLRRQHRPDRDITERDLDPGWEKASLLAAEDRVGKQSAHQALAHASDDEQPDPAPDAPLGDDLVHEQDEDTTDGDLGEDEPRDDAGPQLRAKQGDRGGRQEVAGKHHRQPRQEDHHDYQQLLESLVEDLVTRVLLCIESEQVGTAEQLQHDARRDDGPDAQLHDRSLTGRQDRREAPEHGRVTTEVETEQHHVGQEEIQH